MTTDFMWEQLRLWVGQGVVACARSGPDETAVSDGGVRPRRLYTVLDAREVLGRHRLLRLRAHFPRAVPDDCRPAAGGTAEAAPEAGPTEWSGAWCDGGPEWAEYPDVRAAVGMGGGGGGGKLEAGEFWMCWGDWERVFDAVWVCQLFPASWAAPRSTYPDADPLVVEGRWNRDNRERPLCGGGPSQPSWWANPQFRLVLPGRAQVYLTLTQEDRRYRPRPNRLNGQAPFEKRLAGPARPKTAEQRSAGGGAGEDGGGGAGREYEHAIGMVVVRRSALQAARAGAPLRRADMELATASFRRARDVGIYSARSPCPAPARLS